MGRKTKVKRDPIQDAEDFVEFLRKRVQSANFKENSTKEDFEAAKAKYSKYKLKLKFLKETQ